MPRTDASSLNEAVKGRVALTPEILLSFSDLFLSKNFDEPVRTPAAHLEWWHYVCLPRRYVALAAPRAHAKSTAISHVYVLASLCLRIKKHVLIVSDTEGQASMFVGNIKRELAENVELREAFGVRRFTKESEAELIVEWTDGSKTRIFARGAGQSIRGVNWLGMRPDLIICDDLENDEAVMSEDRREKFRQWFKNTLLQAGSKSCHIRVVGTILHEDSLLARLMPNQIEDPNCVVEPLRITTTTERAWLGILYRAHPDFDDFSQLLWKEQWSEAQLKEVRQTYLDDGDPEEYAQEYLNNPMASEGAYFDSDDLLPILPEERARETASPEAYYIAGDFAISQKARRAYTVFIVCGLAADGVLRVREVIRRRMDALEINDTMFDLNTKYQHLSHENLPPQFLIEKENIAKSLGPFLYQEMEERDTYLNIEMMPPIQDKLLRGRAIQARIRAHMVEFDHEAKWWPTLKHEMITFPRSTYKDQVDALAWIGQFLAKMAAAPTWNQLADYAYDEEYAEAEEDWGSGRNSITGY